MITMATFAIVTWLKNVKESTSTRPDSHIKTILCMAFVRSWRAQMPPGRFLKLDIKNQLWTDVGYKQATRKTSQALRKKNAQKKQNQVINRDGDSSEGSEYPEDSAVSNKVDTQTVRSYLQYSSFFYCMQSVFLKTLLNLSYSVSGFVNRTNVDSQRSCRHKTNLILAWDWLSWIF